MYEYRSTCSPHISHDLPSNSSLTHPGIKNSPNPSLINSALPHPRAAILDATAERSTSRSRKTITPAAETPRSAWCRYSMEVMEVECINVP